MTYGFFCRLYLNFDVIAQACKAVHQFSLGKILETTLDEIGYTIHPHPTMSETIMEAAHAGMGGAIHM
mgnify:CR=1 FL=1